MNDPSVYAVLHVPPDARIGDEPMGTKRKFWWKDQDGTRWLFKYARPGTGEHWAEKVAAEIGVVLGVPCAAVELGECEGEAGCALRSFLPERSASLVHGNELLQRIDATYPLTQLRGVSKHTVAAVLDALADVEPPAGVATDQLPTAGDWFVGYLRRGPSRAQARVSAFRRLPRSAHPVRELRAVSLFPQPRHAHHAPGLP